MKTIISITLGLALLVGNNSPLNGMSLKEAIETESIAIACRGLDSMSHYGKALGVIVKNQTDQQLEVSIDRGSIFEADPLLYQNFIVTRPALIVLEPGQKISTSVYAMCIESHDSGPDGETSFSYRGHADDTAQVILAYLDQNDLMNPLGQEAIWAWYNREPIESVYSLDTTAAKDLRSFLQSNTRLPLKWEEYSYDSYQVRTSRQVQMKIGGMVEYYSSKKGDEVYIALFSEEGVLQRELYYNPEFPSGKVKVDYEFDAAEFTAPAYLVRLTIDGAIKYERRIDLSVLPNRD